MYHYIDGGLRNVRQKNDIEAAKYIAMRCELSFAQSHFAFDGLVMSFGFREFGRISTAC